MANPPDSFSASRRDTFAIFGGLIVSGCQNHLSRAAAEVERRGIIDVHHHITPPAYAAVLRRHSAGAPPQLNWSIESSLEALEASGVARALTSISAPGVHFGDDAEARRLARECNEFAAQLAIDHKGRFGTFAALPLPDIEGSLQEITYALDILDVDGFGLLTNYAGHWLGDPVFEPVMAALDRRSAIVYTHPTIAACCVPNQKDIVPALIEFGTDTSRAIAQILFSGTSSRYPNIKFIFSHGGGTAPFLAGRIARYAQDALSLGIEVGSIVPNGAMHELQRFYYDTAQLSHPASMAALNRLVPPSQVLFGTDFPFQTAQETLAWVRQAGLAPSALDAICHGNAIRLGLAQS